MKKLLIVHNFYRNYGGEDSNIYEEIKFLENDYRVEFFNAKNEDKFSITSIHFRNCYSFPYQHVLNRTTSRG